MPLDDKGLSCKKAGNKGQIRIECSFARHGLKGPHYFTVLAFNESEESELSNEV